MTQIEPGNQAAFVLVPGACHGGWWFDGVTAALTASGHEVAPLTLVGLEHEPDTDRRINLDSHVDQVSAAVLEAELGPGGRRPVVLVA